MNQKPEAGKMEGVDMPEGSSTEGMTDNALGGASMADVKKGFTALTEERDSEFDFEPMPQGGFLGRANGWER